MHVDINEAILNKNEEQAERNRALTRKHKVFVLDILASPGSGKTSTILSIIRKLKDRYAIAVIEGDIASSVDAQTIKAEGIPAVQINTGGACHLESKMIARAYEVLDLESLDLIIIENVGNLVCPCDFDLGEDMKLTILSVPEGHDKPLKYPSVFQASEALVLNKIDTLPVFDFDLSAFESYLERLNPHAPLFKISATRNEGIEPFIAWLETRMQSEYEF